MAKILRIQTQPDVPHELGAPSRLVQGGVYWAWHHGCRFVERWEYNRQCFGYSTKWLDVFNAVMVLSNHKGLLETNRRRCSEVMHKRLSIIGKMADILACDCGCWCCTKSGHMIDNVSTFYEAV